MLFRRILWVFLVMLIVVSCSSSKSKDELDPPTPLVEITPSLTLETAWKTRIRGYDDEQFDIKLVPVTSGDKLFIASPGGQVVALDIYNGNRLWKAETDSAISGGVGIGSGLIVVGTHNGEVIALSEGDGKELWRVQVSSEVLSPPAIAANVIVVRTVDGKLFGLEPQAGSTKWIYERTLPILTLRGTSAPVILGGEVVVAGFDNGKLVVLELATGKLLTEKTIAIPTGRTELERMVDIDTTPKIADQVLYLTGFQGHTLAMNVFNAEILWKRDIYSFKELAVDGQAVYISDPQSHLWAFDRRANGNSLWKQEQLHNRNVTAPASAGEYVVVGDFEGYLHWMAQHDGHFVARHQLGSSHIQITPIVFDNLLIAIDSVGKLIALRFD